MEKKQIPLRLSKKLYDQSDTMDEPIELDIK